MKGVGIGFPKAAILTIAFFLGSIHGLASDPLPPPPPSERPAESGPPSQDPPPTSEEATVAEPKLEKPGGEARVTSPAPPASSDAPAWYLPSKRGCLKLVVGAGITAALAGYLWVSHVAPPVRERDRWAETQAAHLVLPSGLGETSMAEIEASPERYDRTLAIVAAYLTAQAPGEALHSMTRLRPAEVWRLLIHADEPEGVPPNGYPVGEIRRMGKEAGFPEHVWLDPRHWTTFYQERSNREPIQRLLARALKLDWEFFYKPELGPLAPDATVEHFIKRQLLRYKEPIR